MGFLSRFLKTNQDAGGDRRPAGPETKPQYRAVTVIPGGSNPCAAVQRLAGRRFLTADAPRLPLPDCDQPACECRYLHYKDRRTDIRRDADLGIGTTTSHHEDDRRTNRGDRRTNDSDD